VRQIVPPAALRRGAGRGALLVVLAVLALGCGSPPAAVAPSASAASPASPVASGSPQADASGGVGVGPSPTPWPGGIVEAVVILGKADLEIQAAGADLATAAADENLDQMSGAADGLATLLERLQGQVDRLRDYPLTAPVATAYDGALPDMLAGAKQIRDSIRSGDAAGVTGGFALLAKGTAAYQEARRQIGPLVEPALLMQRILVK